MFAHSISSLQHSVADTTAPLWNVFAFVWSHICIDVHKMITWTQEAAKEKKKKKSSWKSHTPQFSEKLDTVPMTTRNPALQLCIITWLGFAFKPTQTCTFRWRSYTQSRLKSLSLSHLSLFFPWWITCDTIGKSESQLSPHFHSPHMQQLYSLSHWTWADLCSSHTDFLNYTRSRWSSHILVQTTVQYVKGRWRDSGYVKCMKSPTLTLMFMLYVSVCVHLSEGIHGHLMLSSQFTLNPRGHQHPKVRS